MSLSLGLGLALTRNKGGVVPPYGYSWLTLNGQFLTLNGQRLMVKVQS